MFDVRGNQAQSTSFFLDSFVSLCESLTQKQQCFYRRQLNLLNRCCPQPKQVKLRTTQSHYFGLSPTIPKNKVGDNYFLLVLLVLNSYFREIRVQSYRLRGQSDKKWFSLSRFEEYELGINVEIRLMFCSLSVFNIQVKVKNDIWFTRPGTYPVLPSLFQH